MKQFCDRCGADITGKPSTALHSVTDQRGSVTELADLCGACARDLVVWLKTQPVRKATR
jgi:hypothetical protein